MNVRATLRLVCAVGLISVVVAARAAAPQTVTASYDVFKDGLHIAIARETFEKSGAQYRIVSETNPVGLLALFFRGRIKAQSNGTVTPNGLRPEHYEYRRLDDASKDMVADFDWRSSQLRMSFDGRTETAQLTPGMQDRVSVMYQFLFLRAETLRELVFQMTNGKKIELYRYQLAGSEQIATPLGTFKTLHLVKQREADESATEVWVAPDRNLFPVKLVIVESDGSRFEQLITQLEFK